MPRIGATGSVANRWPQSRFCSPIPSGVPNRENLTGRINAWKHILNALTIHYGDRIDATTR